MVRGFGLYAARVHREFAAKSSSACKEETSTDGSQSESDLDVSSQNSSDSGRRVSFQKEKDIIVIPCDDGDDSTVSIEGEHSQESAAASESSVSLGDRIMGLVVAAAPVVALICLI